MKKQLRERDAHRSQKFLSGTTISHDQGCGESKQLGPQPTIQRFFRVSNGSALNTNQVIWAVGCLWVPLKVFL